MQPLRIVIDVRHIKDFGIGTYIRNLVKALASWIMRTNTCSPPTPTDVPDLPRLPGEFRDGRLSWAAAVAIWTTSHTRGF